MKNILFPPFKGKIKEIYVKPGQMVSKNHVLVELE
jgi:multidrug efflux pump subunit AcrA (membrane-fusion protein)